jgi:hypothetical protein
MEDEVELLTDPVRTLCAVYVPKEEVVEEEEDLELAEGEVEEGAEGDAPADGEAAAGDEDSDG